MPFRIGIDIGGAFTDLVALDEDNGDVIWVKVETTPRDLSEGVVNALDESKVDLKNARIIVHGQTFVINSVITREGSKVGLITTRGHRDVLELQRSNRRDIYNFRYRKPEPFVPRYLRLEVRERIWGDGSVLTPLNRNDVEKAFEKFLEEGVESICVGYLNSYVNPIHELETRKILFELMEKRNAYIPITLSHEITREWGEYERINTCVLNAFVKPKWIRYLDKLESEFKNRGFKGNFYLMLSNGGMALSSYVKEMPVLTIESGPVAGVIGGIAIAEAIGERNIIVLDGGSTTTKASLVENLVPRISNDYYVGRDRFNPGYPVKVPVIEIAEVGNGGTSIAWIDELGRLRVGPKAAGADPGPACYGKGGDKPTVTDAYVVTGLLNPRYLLGGALKIYKELAVKAIKPIADHYNVSIEEASEGIIRIANDNAANVIKLISVQRGYDPRDFSLIAHGGSGPMFAPFIAEELEIKKIIVPAIPPGVFSAWSMLLTDVRHDVLLTNVITVNEKSLELINKTYRELSNRVLEIFREEGFMEENVVLFYYADMRYKGQEHTVKVPLGSKVFEEGDLERIINLFHEYHERSYSFKLPGNPVQIVNFHVVGIARLKKPRLREVESRYSIEDAVKEWRKVFLEGREVDVCIYDRNKLPVEKIVKGPAIIEDPTSTILVLENQEFMRDKLGNVIIYRR
ncbi:hydantoinase/oxoprolinase family protein [Thermofilum sp.]|uniref:hydantoinase/oxoprolinase family protein n=1 Tax=Thermofilum sp. TaxID=1961369 RepID=UPI003167E33E